MSVTPCQHLINWPDPKLIRAGLMVCPYCETATLREALRGREKEIEDLTAELAKAHQMSSALNASNTALQRLLMETPKDEAQIAELLRINRDQYTALG